MSRYTIGWDVKAQAWFIEDSFALKYNRHTIGPFLTLLQAENYVTRELCPDEVEPA